LSVCSIIECELELITYGLQIELSLLPRLGLGRGSIGPGLPGEEVVEIRLRALIMDSKPASDNAKIFVAYRACVVVVEAYVATFVALQHAPPGMLSNFK
jgi:hypothetical protein